jgi:hypothetical protein
MPTRVSTELTDDDMTEIDEEQEACKPGDNATLAGQLWTHDGEGYWGRLDLCVNGETHGEWVEFQDLPEPIQSRLVG